MSKQLTHKVIEGARHCYSCGDFDRALEYLRIGFAADYSEGKKYFNDTAELKNILSIYKNIADNLGYKASYMKKSDAKIKIALVIPLLIDNTVAFSKRVLFFAKYYDPEKYEIKVYSSEDLAPFGGDSFKRGPKYLKLLSEMNISFWAADPALTISNAAVALADQLKYDQIDALIMQFDPTSATAWLASYLSAIPVKVLIHIGSAIFQPGLTYTLYDNEMIMKNDQKHWSGDFGKQVHLRRGTDIDFVDGVKPRKKIRNRIFDEDTIIVGTLSNHLDTRMSDEYKQIIIGILKKYPNVIFMPIGNIESEQTLKIFHDNELEDRIVWAGIQKNPIPYLKKLDIYACEFPEGGSQSIVEAMACSRPIVAMRCGESHHTSIAFEIVGTEWAIGEYNLELYKQSLEKLIEDENYRKNSSLAMRDRALEHYSIAKYVNDVCQIVEDSIVL